MNENKRWIAAFLLAAFVTSLAVFAVNAAVDPYGVFSEPLLGWYGYSMNQKPRFAKVTYLEENPERYDAFIVGGSKCNSLRPEYFEKYEPDLSYYSFMIYSGDFYDYEKIIQFLVKRQNAKKIVLHLSGREMEGYHREVRELHPDVEGTSRLKYYFNNLKLDLKFARNKLSDVLKVLYDPDYGEYILEDGTFNRDKWDARPRYELSTEELFKTYPDLARTLKKQNMSACGRNVQSLADIAAFCSGSGVELVMIVGTAYEKEMDSFDIPTYIKYLYDLAGVMDYWDFSGYHSVSCDPYKFYDSIHYTRETARMQLAFMYGDKSVEVPQDFGCRVTKDNVKAYLLEKYPSYADVIEGLAS